ncbi:MAG: YggT family protein [Desulfobacteraceae bacterium]|nr:YggT family protein [Desulfobacteraceae bacterium]
MYALGYLLVALAKVIDWVLVFVLIVVFARVVLSWVNPDPFNPIVRFINNVTEPILYPIRTKLPLNFGGLDLSPIIVFLGVMFLRSFLVKTLLTAGYRLI